ncbi:MAG: N-acetylmuramoyl-L-alanine amidase [Blautia sp.]|nr:N-acetylmuramoyl-L-alanine amidase [Lachnoclostridium sp.]MCM1212338.1 N-acetylmuramoyl-L-alanine amidase [Blautia sp.]
MYAGGSYVSRYCNEYFRKKKRLETGKKLLAGLMSVCLLGSAAAMAHTISITDVIDTPSKTTEECLGSGLGVLPAETFLTEEISDKAAGMDMLIEHFKTPVIFIDAGHGGEDGGCSRDGIYEKTINLEIALRVQEKLLSLGYEVIMSRENDVYMTKEERVRLANDSHASLYISIHQNASEDASVNGMEVWYDGTDETRDNKRLAQLIGQQTARNAGAAERELRGNAEFHVTGSTKMPACLIETGFLSNAAERGKLITPEYQEQLAEGIVNGVAYYFHPKTMYLTFDDGPSEENTTRILDILKARGIKATFFLIGENVEKYPEMARRIVAEGHTIGIHCNIHNYNTLYQSVDSYLEDFEKAHQIVYEVTGVDTKLFRFPGGSVNAYNKKINEAIIDEMTQRGYIYYDWNASLEDAAKGVTPDRLIQNAMESTLNRKKIIMLAHDVVYNTSLCLNDLLDSFPEYAMKPLDETVAPVQF